MSSPARPWAWTFERMQAWVKKNLNKDPYFAADGTVIAWTFFKRNDWKKYGAKKPDSAKREHEHCEPAKNFMFRQVHTIRLCKALSEKYRDEAPLGIYFIPFFQKDWPILVVPTAHEGHPFVYGDHISLPYEPAKHNVKLHLTRYIPDGKVDVNPRRLGVVQRRFADLPSPCPFPPTSSVVDLDTHRDLVIDFLSYAKGIRPSQTKRMAGGSSTVVVTETPAEMEGVDLSARAVEKWDAARFECLCILGVRTAAGYDVTVTSYDRWGAVGETWSRPMMRVSLAEVTPATLFPHVEAWLERGRNFLTTDPAELDRLYVDIGI